MKKRVGVQILIGLTGLGFLVYGVKRGELSVILNKAANICLECIGIG